MQGSSKRFSALQKFALNQENSFPVYGQLGEGEDLGAYQAENARRTGGALSQMRATMQGIDMNNNNIIDPDEQWTPEDLANPEVRRILSDVNNRFGLNTINRGFARDKSGKGERSNIMTEEDFQRYQTEIENILSFQGVTAATVDDGDAGKILTDSYRQRQELLRRQQMAMTNPGGTP